MPIETSQHDVVVIGSGPGGEGAAMQAAKDGRSVVVVERYGRVGGGCTHWGTIPSKALRHAIQELTDFRRNPFLVEAVRKKLQNDQFVSRAPQEVVESEREKSRNMEANLEKMKKHLEDLEA